MVNLANKTIEKIEKDKKKMKGFVDEFKTFIARGNVLDLAVGVIVGGAFTKIVTSLVNDILTPVIGVIVGGHDLSNLTIKIGEASIAYGSFIQNVIDFLIVAFCIFIFIKLINKFFIKKKEEETNVVQEPVKTDEVLLLEEIRDLLKKQKSSKK